MSSTISQLIHWFQKRTIFFRIVAIVVLITGMHDYYEFQRKHLRHAQQKVQLDFPAYYLAQAMTSKRLNLYSLHEIENAASEEGVQFERFRANLYSPPFYLFTLALPHLEIHKAQALFLSIKALLLSALVLALALYITGMERYRLRRFRKYRVILLTGLGFWTLGHLNPVVSDFRDGQINVFTLATLVLALFTERKYPVISGIAVSLGGVIKLSPYFLGIKAVLEKRWKLIVSLILSSAILGIASLLYFGFDTIQFYVKEVLLGFVTSNRIPVLDWPINHTLNQSFKGLFYRLFISNFDMDLGGTAVVYFSPFLGKSLTLLANGTCIASCIYLSYKYIKPMAEDRWKASLVFSYYVAIMTMVSPLTWYHHQVVLILPLLVVGFYSILELEDSYGILIALLFCIWLFSLPPLYVYLDGSHDRFWLTDMLMENVGKPYRGFSALYYAKLLANMILAFLTLLVIRKELHRAA